MNFILFPTLILAFIFFFTGQQITKKLETPTQIVLLGFAGFLLAIPALVFSAYYLHVLDHAAWFFNLRALPYTELLAAGFGFTGGILQHHFLQWPSLPERKAVIGLLLPSTVLACVLVPYSKMILSPLETQFLKNRWRDGVCIQTTNATCGPCSVATFLKQSGIELNEQEVAKKAFTSSRGTEVWYLARILQNHGFKTEFVFLEDKPQTLEFPSIAGVVLKKPAGIGHFISIFKKGTQGYEISDPLSGRHTLTREALKKKYHFTGFFMRITP